MSHVRRGHTALGLAIAVAIPAALQFFQPAAEARNAPQPNRWVTYLAFGNNSGTMPPGGGDTVYVMVGDLRWPIFSIRTGGDAGRELTAEILTPASFDADHLRAGDIHGLGESTDPHSRASERAWQMQTILNHHRPALAIAVDRRGRVRTVPSPELARHQACARRLMREAVDEQIGTAATEPLRRRAEERRDEVRIARRLEPPVDTAALLLRLAVLPLPDDDAAAIAMQQLEERLAVGRRDGEGPTQSTWRFAEAREHGRSVGRAIDLRADRNSSQARLCRSLSYTRLREVRIDTCRVQAVVDRRDGWPIKISIVREGRGTDGATEAQLRIFDRLAPLEGYQPPANPCAAEIARLPGHKLTLSL